MEALIVAFKTDATIEEFTSANEADASRRSRSREPCGRSWATFPVTVVHCRVDCLYT